MSYPVKKKKEKDKGLLIAGKWIQGNPMWKMWLMRLMWWKYKVFRLDDGWGLRLKSAGE